MDKVGRTRIGAAGENYRLPHLSMVPPTVRTLDPYYQAVVQQFLPREWNTMSPEEQGRFQQVYDNNQQVQKIANRQVPMRGERNPFFTNMANASTHANSNAAFLKGLFGGAPEGGGDAPPLTASAPKFSVPAWMRPDAGKPKLSDNFRTMLRRLIAGE